MPLQIKGCGTAYLGEKDPGPDGAHTTTEWITVLYVPVYPLRSLRIIRDPYGNRGDMFSEDTSYRALERIPLDRAQVASTCVFTAFSVAWIGAMAWFFLVMEQALVRPPHIAMALVLCFVLSLALPAVLL